MRPFAVLMEQNVYVLIVGLVLIAVFQLYKIHVYPVRVKMEHAVKLQTLALFATAIQVILELIVRLN